MRRFSVCLGVILSWHVVCVPPTYACNWRATLLDTTSNDIKDFEIDDTPLTIPLLATITQGRIEGAGASQSLEGRASLCCFVCERFLLALLGECNLAPVPFHESFSHKCVNRWLQGVFPESVVDSYVGL